MCLAVPGEIEEIFETDGLKMAKINFGGIRRTICLEYTPEAAPGEFVLVHVGFAISVIDKQEADRTFELLRLAGELKESLTQVEQPK